ncbi:uncharacterized protein METZ01_LOCUS8307 [marine metagenome]|jgi:hypothetical protein|uniref:DUF2232 domain-containing protein n=1 Tax=marine metagenome TaxID=408172 RepID=A0A381NPK0_9ZZZZ|tara:strand:+ start:539 stop:1369 length:831 start_codon:yes stop_codon:yes gene_type:complete
MRGLAEFVMSGRKQAIMAVIFLGLIPLVNLLNPVVVGLMVLRKGVLEVAIIFAWAILPIGAWAIVGDIAPLIMLFGISGLAWLLRETESWETTLLATIAIGLSVEIYLRLQPAVLDGLFQQLELLLVTNSLQGIQLEDIRESIGSFIGVGYMFLAIVLLMLARWMQATLFNPGGFQKEFHQLHIGQKTALGLAGLIFLGSYQLVIPQSWVFYFILPLLFSGIALVHAVVVKKKLSSLWLVIFYILLIVLPTVLQLLVLLALVDSWYDFRSRLQQST